MVSARARASIFARSGPASLISLRTAVSLKVSRSYWIGRRCRRTSRLTSLISSLLNRQRVRIVRAISAPICGWS